MNTMPGKIGKDISEDISLSSLLQNISDIVVVISKDQKIIALSSNAEAYFNCKESTIVGKNYTNLCKDLLNLNLMNTKYDGIEWYCVDLAHSANKNPACILLGKPFNPQKLMSLEIERLKSENKILQDIISSLPGSIYWKNKDGVYLGCNDFMVETAGLSSKDDIVGKSDSQLWPNQVVTFMKNDKMVIKLKKPVHIEEQVDLPNGIKRYFTVQKTPLYDEHENIIGIIGNSIEITELKLAKDAAEAADQAKSDFMANMSHDLRTPLTGVIGLSQALENTLQNPEDKENAHLVSASGEQLLNMLNEILDDVRAGHMVVNDLSKESFDLQKCLNDLVELELPTVRDKGLKLSVSMESSVPRYIVGDRKKIHHILLNLVGNAIKFTESGEITIGVKSLESKGTKVHLEFSVTDTGIGIPEELHGKVFERFFRVSPSYKGRYKGHGLGLHIAQSYVNLLGGDIGLKSKEGIGTTIYFDLKCKVCQEKEVVPVVTTIPHNKIKPTKNTAQSKPDNIPLDKDAPYLLLVEDNDIAMKVLISAVTTGGCRFESAEDGEQALILAKKESFDLIITDIGLPGISGHEFVRQFRDWETSMQKTPLPIVGLTAHARDVAMKECLESGMNDVFTKPMTSEMLNTLKKDYISKKSVREESNNSSHQSAEEASTGLGLDLPNTEEELFLLESYPLLDAALGLQQVNQDEAMYTKILNDFSKKMIPDTLTRISEAYASGNWNKVEELAHYLKGSTLYCGTIKMKFACQYLERYRKAGHSKMLDELYQQMLKVTNETQAALEEWLSSK